MAGHHASWAPGTALGDYEIGERLGAGAMGQVYAARHRQTQARVAVKTLSDLANAEGVLRFQREAEAQARVDAHPNVVRIHSSGVHQGRPYLVMDLASGGDLQQRLADGPLAPVEAAQLVAELARGLEHCHRRGVLHRDLKPANVLFDEEGRPKLVDFGLASLAGAHSLTETGTVVGTPAYMAPEQAQGRADAIGPRTDVYGLGALLYHCLAGRPPHQGKTLWETMRQVAERPPLRPGALVPGLPPALERICLQALSKRAQDRPPSAEALAEALEHLPNTPDRRPGLAFAMAACAALLVGLVAAWAGAGEPAPNSQRSARPTESASPANSPLGAEDLSPPDLPAVTAFERRLLDDPVGFCAEVWPRVQAGDLSQAEELCAAIVIAAPLPWTGRGDVKVIRNTVLLQIVKTWAGQPDRIPPHLREAFLASSELYRGKVRMSLEGPGSDELLRAEELLVELATFAQVGRWDALDQVGATSLPVRLSALLERLRVSEAWHGFPLRVRTQRCFYVLRDWLLTRADQHKQVESALLVGAIELFPEGQPVRELTALRHAYMLARRSDGFREAPPEEPADFSQLRDGTGDDFLASSLTYLTGGADEHAERALLLAQDLSPDRLYWRGRLLLRVIERWLPGATLRSWEGTDTSALAPFLDFDRPDLFRDPRPVAVLRSLALFSSDRWRENESFVTELGPKTWWTSPDDALADHVTLYANWRSVLAAEVALLLHNTEISSLLVSPLAGRDYSQASWPQARALGLHLRHLRAIHDALGRPTVPPNVPAAGSTLGRATAYLPVWRSVSHTRRAVRAIEAGWRPWQTKTPGPRPQAQEQR